VCDIVVKIFTFAISSPDKFLFSELRFVPTGCVALRCGAMPAYSVSLITATQHYASDVNESLRLLAAVAVGCGVLRHKRRNMPRGTAAQRIQCE